MTTNNVYYNIKEKKKKKDNSDLDEFMNDLVNNLNDEYREIKSNEETN